MKCTYQDEQQRKSRKCKLTTAEKIIQQLEDLGFEWNNNATAAIRIGDNPLF
jgi:hypothetical protein